MGNFQIGNSLRIDRKNLLLVGFILARIGIFFLIGLLIQCIGLHNDVVTRKELRFIRQRIQFDRLLQGGNRLIVILQRNEDLGTAEPQFDVLGITGNRIVEHRNQFRRIAQSLFHRIQHNQTLENILILREFSNTGHQGVFGFQDIGTVRLTLAIIIMEQVVIDHTVVIRISHFKRLIQQFHAASIFSSVLLAGSSGQIARIVKARSVGSTASRTHLRTESGFESLRTEFVFTDIIAGIAQLRTVVADRHKLLLDFRTLLGIEFVSLVQSSDRLIDSTFLYGFYLLPADYLAVRNVNRHVIIVLCSYRQAVDRNLIDRFRIAQRQTQLQTGFSDIEVLGRSKYSLDIALTQIEPGSGFRSLLRIGTRRFVLFDLLQQGLLVDFLCLGSSSQQGNGGQGQNKFFHNERGF